MIDAKPKTRWYEKTVPAWCFYTVFFCSVTSDVVAHYGYHW